MNLYAGVGNNFLENKQEILPQTSIILIQFYLQHCIQFNSMTTWYCFHANAPHNDDVDDNMSKNKTWQNKTQKSTFNCICLKLYGLSDYTFVCFQCKLFNGNFWF